MRNKNNFDEPDKIIITFVSMKKITTYLFSFSAILLFLVSSTGISFVIHHCSDNHTEEVRFFTSDYQCSHEKTAANYCDSEKGKGDQHQCNIHKKHHCCKNTKGYFKINDDYTFNRNNTIDTPFIAFISNSFLYTEQLFVSVSGILNSNNPPFYREGQDFLCLHSQFRI